MLTTLDNRRWLPEFKILKAAVNEVMDGQVALTFEDSRSTVPVASPFQASNEIMKQMGKERKPVPAKATSVPPPSMDELTWMFQSLDRPIRHVVASFQGPTSCNPAHPLTPTRQSAHAASLEYKASCGSLEPMWYPPAVSSQLFAGTYEADPAGRKRHKESRPFKAPLTPASQARKTIQKPSQEEVQPSKSDPAEEPEMFDWIMNGPNPNAPAAKGAPSQPATPPKLQDLSLRFEDVKKWVSRCCVEVGSEDLKVNSGTIAKGIDPDGKFNPILYFCPLGYLNCCVGKGEAILLPLVDSGSQLNLISDTMAAKLNLTPWVNFSSAVYGINNEACELIGVAKEVPIQALLDGFQGNIDVFLNVRQEDHASGSKWAQY
ncbi:hypothetical protein PTTG_03258 [Puccinia triticina 1-1 BBBD Race 1]|uniref:Aspartic peptidase DDI1-type domain-containing protein n=1 Tax=Puccinia triticina (isolate 1-1 / race 1 (BBBD)) TaxID=630390 RepID=A0A180GJV4_PUCT1|nr:hypothetical protein PTTG_03258 [Puccinia triticina 1-1 BBBD Race 1]